MMDMHGWGRTSSCRLIVPLLSLSNLLKTWSREFLKYLDWAMEAFMTNGTSDEGVCEMSKLESSAAN